MMFLSAALESAVHSELGRLGDSSTWLALDEIGGGCINHASRLQTGRGLYLLKWNPRPAPGMIAAEVRGLELLRETRTVRVPEVLAWREAEIGRPAFALLEWLSGPVFRAEALGARWPCCTRRRLFTPRRAATAWRRIISSAPTVRKMAGTPIGFVSLLNVGCCRKLTWRRAARK